MRSGDKGHRSCKGHQEMNQALEMLRSQIWLTNSGESPPAANGWSQWTREPGAGRPHLTTEPEATPLPVSCQGWAKQGLMGKGQPPLSSGLPFPLLSLSVQVPQDLAKGGEIPISACQG